MPPPYPITGRPHRKLCGRLFFVPGRRRAAGAVCGAVCLWDGLSAGLSAGRTVCVALCLWDGQFAAPESFQGRGQGRNRGTGQGNRETGNRGRKSGRPVGGRFAGRMFPGRGEWPFLRSPKYLRRISCTVRNNPVYLQVRTEEANR